MPKIKGPKDGKIISASFDGKTKSLFPSLKETKNLVLLSIVGNNFCQGEYLEAIVQNVIIMHQNNAHHTIVNGKSTFLIADEIYWHNLKPFNPSQKEILDLKKEAVTLGDKYLADNIKFFLTPLQINVNTFNKLYSDKTIDEKIEIINQIATENGKCLEIVRWGTWMNRANDHKNKLNQLMLLYDHVEGLKDAMNKSIESYVTRHSSDSRDLSKKLLCHRSRGYLTEESASIMWLSAMLGYNFIIYPGSILPVFASTKEYLIVEEHRDQIIKGQNVKTECAHSELCIHVKNPSRLASWLEVNFKRSHTQVENIKRKSKNKDSLAQAFEGITKALLRDNMPLSDKIRFLQELLNYFVEDKQQQNNEVVLEDSKKDVSKTTIKYFKSHIIPGKNVCIPEKLDKPKKNFKGDSLKPNRNAFYGLCSVFAKNNVSDDPEFKVVNSDDGILKKISK